MEDFYHYCEKLGGASAQVMMDILQFEADRRTINITVNSIGTELQKEDRGTLYPSFGLLHPEGTEKLMKADDQEQVKAILENYQVRSVSALFPCDPIHWFLALTAPRQSYRAIAGQVNADKSMEDAFFEREVKLNMLAFEQQAQYGVFYAYVKLKVRTLSC